MKEPVNAMNTEKKATGDHLSTDLDYTNDKVTKELAEYRNISWMENITNEEMRNMAGKIDL